MRTSEPSALEATDAKERSRAHNPDVVTRWDDIGVELRHTPPNRDVPSPHRDATCEVSAHHGVDAVCPDQEIAAPRSGAVKKGGRPPVVVHNSGAGLAEPDRLAAHRIGEQAFCFSRIAQARAPRAFHAVGEARAYVRARTRSARGASASDFGGRAEAHAAIPVGVDRLPHRHR
jgi:hypothetical protein